LIYSGDVDGAVPTIGTRRWIKKLVNQLKMNVVSGYTPWTIVEGQVAGYKEIWEGLEFVTVKGTGHMVPQWERAKALWMIGHYLNNTAI
jgi:hypothetical protein